MKIVKRICFFLFLFLLITSCEKEVFTGPPDEPPSENAKIFIQSNPSGAMIYYQNKYTGQKTPDTLTWLSSGNQTIKLLLKSFVDTSFVVPAEDKKITNVFVDYSLNPAQYGNLYCRSFPDGASIFLNGQEIGFKTPYTVTHYFPGDYKVKFTKSQCRADSTIAAVEASRTLTVYLPLEDTSKFVSYITTNSGIPDDYGRSIIIDRNNVKWVGSSAGVTSFDGQKWKFYDIGGTVLKLAFDKQFNIWAATTGGLYMYNGTTWINWTSKLPTYLVSDVICDDRGIIWIATALGLVKYDGVQWQVFNPQNSGVLDLDIHCLAAAPDGKLWYGTKGGIGTFDGIVWTYRTEMFTQISSVIGYNIKDINIDENENVWVVHGQHLYSPGGGGLTEYDGLKWTEIILSGLLTNEISSIDIDKNNYKWISTPHGLGKFLLPSNLKVFYNLGYRVLVRNVSASTVDNNEDLWFVTMGDGIVKIKKGNY